MTNKPLQLSNWPKYNILAKMEYWTVREAISYLAVHYLHDKEFYDAGEMEKEALVVYKHISSMVEESVMSFDLAVKPAAYDDNHTVNIQDLNVLKIKPVNFLVWAIGKKLSVPEEFKELLPYYRQDSVRPVRQPAATEVVSNEGETEDLIYPIYKGMQYVDFTEEKFEEIKKYYGMLQVEESKWRRAIPIAAKIGLLFYERNLGKPTTRRAFLKEYKEEFDAILRNDTVAKHIYVNLPAEYRGGSAARETTTNIVSIIKAAVYAGSIYDTEDVKDMDKLKDELKEHKYRVPADEILAEIIKTTQEI